MVYYDNTGSRIHRPLQHSTPSADSAPDDATARYIQQVAAEHPKATPDEVHAEIQYGRGRHDITSQMVRSVLG